MLRFMLDTNSVSYVLKGNPPPVREHLRRVPMAQVCVSSITEAELLFGLALKPQAPKLPELVNQFLLAVSVLPCDSASGPTLVTSDRSFRSLRPCLRLADWSKRR